jgi:predicted MPP superfamily phosphohydrolase
MIVSNGCGDWFPCRIGAPAEIGLLRLTKAA